MDLWVILIIFFLYIWTVTEVLRVVRQIYKIPKSSPTVMPYPPPASPNYQNQ